MGVSHSPYAITYFENVEECKLIHVMRLVPDAWPVVDLQQMLASTIVVIRGFPGGISGKEHACQCRRLKRPRFLGREDPIEKEWQASQS